MRRVGFQAHDGRIFHVLTGRGGVLVAIHSEPRAADALAVLHSTVAEMPQLEPGQDGFRFRFRFQLFPPSEWLPFCTLRPLS